MLIIVKNGQIIGVEKELLNSLNIDLDSVSGFINSVKLQLSALQNTSLEIDNSLYSVEEINIFSTENIKVFKLSAENAEKINIAYNELSIQDTPTVSVSEENNISEIKITSSDDILNNNPFTDTIETSENTVKTENIEEELIKIDDKTQDDQFIVQKKPKKDEKVLNIDLAEIKEETPEPIQQKPDNNENEKLIDIKKEHIEFENNTDFSQNEPKETTLKNSDEDIIEISFEDDLEEIKKTLSLNKNEFNKIITSELKKASSELGIEIEELADWFNQLIEQIKEEKSLIYKYIDKKDYTNLHESYHKLKGAALNLRLSQIALVLKKLDELTKNKENIEKIKKITDDFYKLIENEAVSIASDSALLKENKTEQKNSDNKYIENIVLKTIQTYLNTQNEVQFQKDKKYIEKLLDKKINSIDDLQEIIKGM